MALVGTALSLAARAPGGPPSQRPEPATPATCTALRLDDPGEVLHAYPELPALGGACHAVAAVQLYDAWRYAHGAPRDEVSSPLEAALRYPVLSGRGFDTPGGYACEAVDLLASAGSCDAARVEEGVGRLTARRERQLQACHAALLAPEPPSSNHARRVERACRPVAESLRPGAPVPDLDALVAQAGDPDGPPMSTLTGEHLCLAEGRLVAPGIPPCTVAHATEGPGELVHRIDELLARRPRLPVGIAWCAEALHDPLYTGVDWGPLPEGRANHLPDHGCATHYSVVIGRRWHDGRCQYLVHDSAAHLGGDGKAWIDAATLGRNVYGLFWL